MADVYSEAFKLASAFRYPFVVIELLVVPLTLLPQLPGEPNPDHEYVGKLPSG